MDEYLAVAVHAELSFSRIIDPSFIRFIAYLSICQYPEFLSGIKTDAGKQALLWTKLWSVTTGRPALGFYLLDFFIRTYFY